jgi:hypothetical protein
LTEKDLSRWRLIADFQERLAAVEGEPSRSFADPRRKLGQNEYLSLLLFGLLNPVVESMRGLCAASRLRRTQADICAQPVSLGSFSEAQTVVAPELLAIDGTIWAALPRMAWAVWRWQNGPQSALKAHVKFNLLEDKPVAVTLAEAKRCERAVLREHWQAGEFYVGDRYYGEDYGLFGQLEQVGCSYVLRLRQEAAFAVLEEFTLRPEDHAAGVSFDGWVALGSRGRPGPPVRIRLVRVPTEDGELLLVTDKARGELSAELIALIYRYRWRIELFFKWLKCILGCRHWMAESPRGVALQIYCALIAALLLLRHTGRRPGKRAMEMIRFYLVGYATLDELTRELGLAKKTV